MIKYPKTKREEIEEVLHGRKVADPYRWLEDSSDEAVLNWDKAQNELSEKILDSLPESDYFYESIKNSNYYDVDSIPVKVKKGKRQYFTRMLAEEEKSILMLQEDADSEAVELINPNKWGANDLLWSYKFSNTGRYLAYGIIRNGKEDPEFKILDIDSNKHLSDTLPGHKHSVLSWLPDDSGFYYSYCPLPPEVPESEKDYWHRGGLHILGRDSKEDEVVYADDEVKEIWASAHLTYDQKYLVYMKGLFYKRSILIEKYGSSKRLLLMPELKYDIDTEIFDEQVYILTNEDAPKNCIYKVSCESPERDNWKLIVPEKEAKIEDYAIINGKLFINYLDGIHNSIEIYDLEGKFLQKLKLPGKGIAFWKGYQDKEDIYIFYCDPVTPYIRYKYDFDSNTLKEDFIYINPEFNYDKEEFVTRIEYAVSKDGTQIPLIISHNVNMKKDGSNPTILYGYGGFNVSLGPNFSASSLAFCKRGGIYVTACLRGGGEFGEDWHKAGMKENKQNVFDDFAAAGEFLIKEGYTSEKHLGILGGSNGGLLTGACLVQRPELFAAAIVDVPLLDMVRYHKNKFANIWKEEYGSAEDADEFEYLIKYSPYHNISDEADYPVTLVTGGFNDSRCDPYHARKFAAALQEVAAKRKNENPVLCNIIYNEGHGMGGGKTQMYKKAAKHFAFLLKYTE